MEAVTKPMTEGQKVEVRLYGDDEWHSGVVLDRPRKMWVKLDDMDGLIADESNITEWRRIDQ